MMLAKELAEYHAAEDAGSYDRNFAWYPNST